MSKSLRIILPVLGLALLVSGAASATVLETAVAKGKPARSVNCGPNAEGCARDLVAGQHTIVGSVSVVADIDGTLLVTYDTTGSDWWITEIHFDVSSEAITSSAPGRFIAKPYVEAPTQFFQFSVDAPIYGDTCGNDGDGYYYAAHAVVQEAIGFTEPDFDELAMALPDSVSLTVATAGDGYFQSTIAGGTSLDGTFIGWCIDYGHYITPGQNYDTVNVYSSYEELPASLTEPYTAPDGIAVGGDNSNIDKPENLDLVNWVINNRDGYSDTDVQNAIWRLIDDRQGACSDACLQLVADASAYGEDFRPACGQVVAIILAPVSSEQVTSAQVTIAQVTVSELQVTTGCQPILADGDETAWACGDFIRSGKNWAMTFQCCAE